MTSDERKRIRRAAKRRKRKGYDENDDTLDDFIAPDDELDEEDNHYDYYDFDELPDDASLPSSPTKSTTSSQGTRHHSRGRFEQLTNVILLAGPVSSGKTSTAYAVANELGWQVFEVYPGIGKRGFKDLERYVGMVGENHIMKREAPPVSSFFSKAANAATPVSKTAPAPPITISSNGPSSSQVSVPISINTTEGSINGNDLAGSASTSANIIKQSCILIEEVDTLYESDSGFWEGLISLVSKSRRPVILTCNDVNAVPKDSLPLQEILHFQALSTSVSIALLEEIANLEGKNVGKDVLETIVRAASSPGGEQVDIRQAINQLQYNSTVGSTQAKPLKEGDTAPLQPDLRVIQAVLETASFADAELSRRTSMAMEVGILNHTAGFALALLTLCVHRMMSASRSRQRKTTNSFIIQIYLFINLIHHLILTRASHYLAMLEKRSSALLWESMSMVTLLSLSDSMTGSEF